MAELNVTLPYNLEAEQSVLGSILIDNKCMADANLYLRADYFYLPQHKAIFSAMDYQFMNNGGAIDPVIIADALTKDGTYDLAGGKEYLMQLANVVPSTANIEKYAKIVQEKYYLRNLIQISQSIIEDATSGAGTANNILDSARPAMGKTSFALNLAQNITMGARKRCVFFSLEMTKEQLAERLLASQAGIESQKFRTGELSNDEWIRLGNALSAFHDVELYLDDTAAITVPEIKSIVRRLKHVDCVLIDYLGLIQSAVHKENRVQEVSEITRNLKMMAKDLNIPVICCAQLSRGTEGRGKTHTPQLSDLRESGSIEQDADIVMFLYRPDYYRNELSEEERDEVDENLTELIVAKNRHGGVGTIQLTFDKEFTRFRSIDNVRDYSQS